MARGPSGGQQTAAEIRKKAAESFATLGFAATSLRQVAADVGIKVGSLYNHIDSKQDLLLSIMGGTMDELNEDMEHALKGQETTLEKLIAFVGCHIRFHAEHAQQVFIGNSELRSLDDESRREITEKRREYRERLERLIAKAGEEGLADPIDVRLHTFNIVAMGTHIASWYRADGPLTLDDIVRTYTAMVLRSLNVENADGHVAQAMGALAA